MLRAFATGLQTSVGTAVHNSVGFQPCATVLDSVDACDKLKNRIVQEFWLEVRYCSLVLALMLSVVCAATNPRSVQCWQHGSNVA